VSASLKTPDYSVIPSLYKKVVAEIEMQFEELQTELLKMANTKSDYNDVANGIYTLREENQNVQVDSACKDEIKKRITHMSTFLIDQPTTITEYEETLVRKLIEKLTVRDDNSPWNSSLD